MSWETEIAKQFKQRDNKSLIGVCIGTVTSATPLKASILDGQIMLDGSNTYICNSLLDYSREVLLTGSSEAAGTVTISGGVSGSGSLDGSGSIGGTYATSGAFSASGSMAIDGSITGSITTTASGKSEGKLDLKAVLKVGDLVLVIPSADEQKFFIIDVVKGVK